MKITKRFTLLFLSAMFATVPTLNAMSMRTQHKPIELKQHKCTTKKNENPKQVDPKELRLALRAHENKCINKWLAEGADPNYEYCGYGRPLECVFSLVSIYTLLECGADPKKCQKSPLIWPLLYYIDRECEVPPDFSLNVYEYKEMYQEELFRRGEKALSTLCLLLLAGADANQENNGMLPLHRIIALNKADYLPYQTARVFFEILIWQGADPERIESRFGYTAYNCGSGMDSKYIKQERQKYMAVRLLLVGNKDENSPFSWLPPEILKLIRILIRYGVPFDPTQEKKTVPPKVIPPKVEPVEPTVSEPAGTLQKSKEPEKKVNEQKGAQSVPNVFEGCCEEKEAMPTRSTSSLFRRMPIPILIAGVVVSSISYRVYNKWKNRRRKHANMRQEFWDEDYSNRIVC